MALIPYMMLTSPGFTPDPSPRDIPHNAWTNVSGVRVRDNGIHNYVADHPITPNPSIAPYAITYVDDAAGGPLYLYAGSAAAYALQNGTHTDITRNSGAYTGSKWNFNHFNGVLLANNGVDVPQVWSPPAPGTKLVDLPNWPSNTLAKVVRSYLNYIVALNVTKSGTVHDNMVKWSHYADPGSVPNSWDPTDTTKDAGEYALASGLDPVVDCRMMGNANVIYKRDSIWLMRYTGGVQVFRFDPAVESVGALATNCVASLPNGSHVVLGRGDMYVFNGQGVQSIVDGRTRKWLFSRIDGTNMESVFLAHDILRSEILVCIPVSEQVYADTALVWNYTANSFYIRKLPNISGIAYGEILIGAGETFDGSSGTFNSDNGPFDSLPFNPTNRQLIYASPTNQKIYIADSGQGAEATPGNVLLERISLPVDSDREGNLRVDFTTRKMVTEVWPKVDSVDCDEIRVYVGSQEASNDPIDWSGPHLFNPLTDEYVAVWVNGKIISIRFEVDAGKTFTFLGYSLTLQPLGVSS